MTDHPVFIPTSEGPVGGIVSEPEAGEARAAMILGGGHGRAARSGINAFWTRIARDLCELGVATLRFDYSREGETLPIGEGGKAGVAWKLGFDLLLYRQAVSWFTAHLGGPPLFLAGPCGGGRLAIDFSRLDPEAVAGTFLFAPHLRALPEPGEAAPGEPDHDETVDPKVVSALKAILDRAPSWILLGEHDTQDIPELRRRLGSATRYPLEVEVVPGVAVHLLDQPALQQEVRDRLFARITRALAELEGTPAAIS